MADQPKQINFTIIPADDSNDQGARTYSNFCSIAHTPFDFTLTFCEVMPLSDKEIREAESEHIVRAPVRAKIVVPVQFIQALPYILTCILLAGFIGKAIGPKAGGVPYTKER